MDFFDHQEAARKKSKLLILYFILAVLGIILAAYILAIALLVLPGGMVTAGDLWDPGLFFLTAGGTGLLVLLASSYKTIQLSGGGAVVARELGGREIDTSTTDYHERRLLNLVEEMAIASGMPVPTVYVLEDENSINAFAAGKTPSDAVIGVTRGCMTLLTRDELQGVIAHEFSHILNGDMRLNIRLMGLVFGILFLSLTGELILRSLSRVRRRSSNDKNEGGVILVILAAGLGLYLIGLVGSLFANLIKASISRQREYLADASAVQFTRNPEGIAGALLKIGGLSAGSKVSHPMARDASHLFFGNALSSEYFATHPPLEERIRRILPSWNGKYKKVALRPISESADTKHLRRSEISVGLAPHHSGASVPLDTDDAIASFRTLHPEQVDLGADFLESLPRHWLEACRSLSESQYLIFALLLSQDETLREKEIQYLREHTDETTAAVSSQYFNELVNAHSAVKIGLIDLSIPSLRRLSPDEYQRFRAIIHQLIASDQQIDLFEFMLMQIVTRHLDTIFYKLGPEPIRFHKLEPLLEDTGVVLSTLAAMSHPDDPSAADFAFAQAVDHLHKQIDVEIPRLPASQCGLERIKKALENLAHATPTLKKLFIEACSHSVMADGAISSHEAELIRAAADAIGCPLPPLISTAQQI